MRRWIAVLLVLGVAFGLAACGDDDGDEAGGGAGTTAAGAELNLLEPGVLSVASDIPYVPFEQTEPGSDEVVGFDVDLVKAIAATMGIEDVRFVRQGFDTIILSLTQNRFDMSASAWSITPERAEQVDFSDPYFDADQSILVQEGSDIDALEDLEGRRIGAQRGTTGADLAATVEGAEVQRFELIDDAFSALAGGRVDAVVNDYASSAFAAEQREGLEVVAQVETDEQLGFVFPKNRPELRDAFNAGLAQIREDGTYDEIYRKWFGEDPPASGGSTTGGGTTTGEAAG
jgi:ABC-type amino acid transport substrate-binding protein